MKRIYSGRCGQPRFDLAGRKFGSWTALAVAPNRGVATYWRCRCGCGEEREVQTGQLRSGLSRRCRRCAGTYREITWKGVTRPIGEWERSLGLTLGGLTHRLERGWTLERALTTPRQRWAA